MSHSLARLRELFDDPLFVRSGPRMTPTARAESIANDVRAALDHVGNALESPSVFRPEQSEQIFRISASNDVQIALLPELLSTLQERAPHVRVEISDASSWERNQRELASGGLDLAIGYLNRASSSLRLRKLLDTRIVSLASAAHPRIRGTLSLEQYLEEGHVAIRSTGPIGLVASPDGLLKREGLRRRIAACVDNPEVALLVVARSDLICSASELMVNGLSRIDEIQVLDHPLQMPGHTVAAGWHARTHSDPTHQWFRKQVFGIAERWSARSGRRAAALRSISPH
jgi:DNA-binding transcriptional LysR family regulator